ncbi:MAG: hypothetical protein WAV07_13745, partial [Candidatus Contendobacter sp.]
MPVLDPPARLQTCALAWILLDKYVAGQADTSARIQAALAAAILILAISPGFGLWKSWLEALQHERHQGPPALEAQVTGQGS